MGNLCRLSTYSSGTSGDQDGLAFQRLELGLLQSICRHCCVVTCRFYTSETKIVPTIYWTAINILILILLRLSQVNFHVEVHTCSPTPHCCFGGVCSPHPKRLPISGSMNNTMNRLRAVEPFLTSNRPAV